MESNNVLIINGLEPGLCDHHIITRSRHTFNSFVLTLADYIERNINYNGERYNRVIFTRYTDDYLDETHYKPLLDALDYWYDCYPYNPEWLLDDEFAGYDSGTILKLLMDGSTLVNQEGQTFIAGNDRSEIVQIPDWLVDLQNDRVSLAGIDNVVMDNIRTAFTHLDIVHDTVNEITV